MANRSIKQKDIIEKFFSEIQKGHITQVGKMLKLGVNPNVKDRHGDYALDVAEMYGHVDIMKLLLEAGADPDTPGRQTTLIFNCSHTSSDNIKTIKMLLESGVDVNKKDRFGNTALISATRGHIDIVKLLLEAGADPNLKNDSGDTALITASILGYLKVVILLLVAGADPMIRDKRGHTALDLARQNNHPKVAKLLEKYMMFLALSGLSNPKKRKLPKELVRKIIEAL
jgi:ankyrin repeat protein